MGNQKSSKVIELTDHQKRKYAKGICVTPFCIKKHRPDRHCCYSCIKAQYRQKYPIKYAYQVLKNNARRRGKQFSLTLQEFESFVILNDYMNKRGTKCKSLQIDRIDESKGYTKSNIQAITLRENLYKYRKSKMDLQDAPF